ncbi:unnamed protein product [Vitrella brassicaformis CCMP3155]|uniref:DEP domain-containing protein n=2 Tax=Vitrella brassicaformis TaxID=1169539 RepID=A0A0G4EVX7_VITBC|nr:unnamed protein product [Vitrella brassicaformis CCMP3155]|eukprot:CEM02470.1 unnamed protein product [Vitrella brassicaformis CCMP3155]
MSGVEELATVLGGNFFAIGLGYCCLRTHLLDDVKGITFIVSKIALPLLVFRAVALMDLGSVNLTVIAACTVAKFVVQAAVIVATITIDKSPKNVSRAALHAHFVSSENAFALGIPIVYALFPIAAYPQDLLGYLTALAVLQTVLHTNLSFVLFEAGKAKREAHEQGDTAGSKSCTVEMPAVRQVDETLSLPPSPSPPSTAVEGKRKNLLVKVVSNIITQPLIIMIVAGLLFKAAFGWAFTTSDTGRLRLPSGLHDVVALATEPYVMCALFLTGATVVNNLDALLKPQQVVLPLFLVVLKVMVLPSVMWLFVSVMNTGMAEEELEVYQDFALLFGSIPTSSAPVVFAKVYKVDEDVAGAGVILGLVLGGPLIFVLAILFDKELSAVADAFLVINKSFAVSSMVFAIMVLFILLLIRAREDWTTYPRVLVPCYAASVALSGLLVTILASSTNYCSRGDSDDTWQVAMYNMSNYFMQMSRWCLCGLCLNVALGVRMGLSKARRRFFFLTIAAAFILPLVSLVWSWLGPPVVSRRAMEYDPCLFWYGPPEQVCDATLLLLVLVLLAVALAMSIKARKPDSDQQDVKDQSAIVEREPWQHNLIFPVMVLGAVGGLRLILLVVYSWGQVTATEIDISGSLLKLGMVVSVLEKGQGLLIFLVFAFQSDAIMQYNLVARSTGQCMQKCFHREIASPPVTDPSVPLPSSLLHVVDALGASCACGGPLDKTHPDYHAEKASDRRCLSALRRQRVLVHHCFTGREAVDWMVDCELAHVREEAVQIGKRLIRLGVISHVRQECDFFDSHLLYRYRPDHREKRLCQPSTGVSATPEQEQEQPGLLYGETNERFG